MKRIIGVILVLALIASCVSGVYASSDNKTRAAQNAYDFLCMLGIIDSESTDIEAGVTRAHFCDLLIRSMKMEPDISLETVFSDVPKSMEYSASVNKAYSLGIVSGGGDGLFNPSQTITADAAVKMCIVALGYKAAADAYGGYPVGYLSIANSLKLTNGVSSGDGFTSYDVYRLLYNFLISDVCEATTVNSDGTLTYKRDAGNTPLLMYFNLHKDEGVIKTAGYASMVFGYDKKDSYIYVNGTYYKCGVDNAEKYLGMYADVYFDEEDRVLAIYPDANNTTVLRKADEIESVSGNTVNTFLENGREEKIKLSPSYTFVKNGRSINPAESDFKFENAEYVFLDNDGDGTYDVVFGYLPDYIMVSYTDIVSGIVYDTRGAGKYLSLDTEAGVHYFLTYTNKKDETYPVLAEELISGDVIKYYKSDDGAYVTGEVYNVPLRGKIDEVSKEGITVNGNEYKLNSHFPDPSMLAFGTNYIFYPAIDGTLTDYAAQSPMAMQYGFLVDFDIVKEGIENTAAITILTADNDMLKTELADKITLDGVSGVKKDSDKVLYALTNGNNRAIANYGVIRYAVDANGKVFKIDTETRLSEDEYGADTLTEYDGGNDTLTCHLYNQYVLFYGTTRVLAPNVLLGNNTIMFSVPYKAEDQANYPQEYDEDDFSVVTTSNFPNYEQRNVTMYDINKNMEPAAVIFYEGPSGKNAVVSNNAIPAVVKEVIEGVTEDGDYTTILSLYQGSKSIKLAIDPERNTEFAPADMPAAGDIIRYALNKRGEITNFKVDLRYTPASDTAPAALSTTSQTLNRGIGNEVICYGKANFHSDSVLALNIIAGKDGGYVYTGDIAAFRIPQGCRVIIYDSKLRSAKAGTINSIKDVLTTGNEDASLVAVRSDRHQLSDIFIYE